jgi:hypothetical protein
MRTFRRIEITAKTIRRAVIKPLLPVLLLGSLALPQTSSPVPQIANPLVPTAVVPGSPAFTLTVNGTGFVSGSTVYWNGSPRSSTVVSAAQLTAAITASDVATATSGIVTVHGPSGRISNPVYLLVTTPASALYFGSASVPQTLGTNNWPLLTGDLSGDGFPDLVIGPGENVEAVLGSGNGGFQYPVYYPVPNSNQVSAGVLADVNNDGNLDLLTFGRSNTFLANDVFLGNGDGTFQPALQEFVGEVYAPLAVGDFNGDGNLDFVYDTPVGVGIMFGNGDGTFNVGTQISLTYAGAFVSVGDFNRDGIADIAVSQYSYDGNASILIGNGDGTFAPPVEYAAGIYPSTLAVGDLNGDGFPDIGVANEGNTFSVLMNNGDGTFKPAVAYSGPDPLSSFWTAAFGDFNGDGKLDLATEDAYHCIDRCLYIFPGNGDGTFQPGVAYLHVQNSGGSDQGYLSIADFNLDGKLDVLFPGGSIPFVMVQSAGAEPTLDPGSLVFASQAVGSQSPLRYVSLLQPGSTAITINSTTASANFMSDGACVGQVLNGGNYYCETGVYFSPTTTGALTGFLAINSSGGTQYVSLTGTATPAINIAISPPSLSFGVESLHSTSSSYYINISNTGSQSVDFTSIAITGATPGDFILTNLCSSTVAVGTNCNVQIAFRPTATGPRTASLSIADNVANSPQIVPLSGTGSALHLSNHVLNFGNESVGTSTSETLVLRNLGTRAIAVADIRIGRINSQEYTQTNDCSIIPVRSSCTITITFTPQFQGLLDSVLSFVTNGTGMESTTTVALDGRGY